MAVISNLNTQQSPMTAAGLTGTQVVKFLDAPRVYIKSADSSPTPVSTKSDGVAPSGWTDLGIVDGKLKVTYTKDVKEVRTGVDEVLRQQYVGKKTAMFEFTLSQLDDVVMKELSGLTPSVITSGSVVEFAVGSEDIVQKALLLVLQNKLDGKEIQFYHPNANLSFNIQDSGEFTVVQGRGDCTGFPYGGKDIYFIQRIFK